MRWIKIAKFTLKNRYNLLKGKIRRFIYGHFRKKTVKALHNERKGECARCGACCKLLFVCPFLAFHEDGSTSCKIHTKRPVNCVIFPLDKRDIADRNIIDPKGKCGYIFED